MGSVGKSSSNAEKVKNISLESLGLQREDRVDLSLFNRGWDLVYGDYPKELSEEMDWAASDTTLVSYTSGKNKAYAAIEEESDVLEGLVSTGGGTGTDLLSKVMQYQESKGKGISWLANNPESIKYYTHLGLDKFASGNSKSKVYEISKDQMKEAMELVNKRRRK